MTAHEEHTNLVALAQSSPYTVDQWAAAWRRSSPRTWPYVIRLVEGTGASPEEAATAIARALDDDRTNHTDGIPNVSPPNDTNHPERVTPQ